MVEELCDRHQRLHGAFSGASCPEAVVHSLPALLRMIVEFGSLVLALFVKRTSRTIWAEAMGLKIRESDPYPSASRWSRRIARAFLVRIKVRMGRDSFLQVIHESEILSERGSCHSHEPVRVPSGRGNKANNGPGSNNIPSMDAYKVLIAAHGSAQENAIPPFLVELGSKAGRHKP